MNGRISLILFLFGFVSLFVLLFGCDSDGVEEKKTTGIRATLLNEGERAPDFKLRTFDGQEVNLSDFAGKPVVINFWASWCGPCRKEAEDLERTYSTFKNAGVVFIGIAVQDTEEKAREFVKEFNLTYLNGLDETGDIAETYKIYGIPKTFVVDKSGRFTFIHTGAITEKLLTRELNKVL